MPLNYDYQASPGLDINVMKIMTIKQVWDSIW